MYLNKYKIYILKGYHMYYGGSLAEVTVDKLAYVLEGFKFIEVRIERYNLFPTLLLTSIIALLFLSPKKERKLFVIYSAFAGIAIISLVFIPSLNGLFCAITVLLITAVIFLLKKFEIFTNPERALIKKALKVTGIVVLVLGSLVFLGLLLNNQSKIPFVHNITSSNSLLNRIFNSNRFVNAINPLMTDVLCSDRFLGFVVTDSIFQEAIPLSGSFYFDTFMTSGVIGLAAIIFALVIGLKGFKNYLSKENDNFYVKAILLTITIFYLIYIGIFNVSEYGIFYSIYQPSFISGPFMIIIFILSYVLAKGGIKEKVIETAKESPSISEEEKINE